MLNFGSRGMRRVGLLVAFVPGVGYLVARSLGFEVLADVCAVLSLILSWVVVTRLDKHDPPEQP